MSEALTPEWRCFLEAARLGSVSKAADRLHLPQPSVTKYVRRLESALGTRLFLRGNRGITLTETGAKLFRKMDAVQGDLRDGIRTALQSEGEIAGEVSVGAHRTVALHHLPERIGTLLRTHPHLRVDLRLATSLEISRLVAAGQLDYGFVANPIPLAGLVIRRTFEEEVAVYAAKKQTLDDLERVFYSPEMQLLPKILKTLAATPVEAVPDYDVLASLARHASRTGALLPQSVARGHGLEHRISPVFYRASIAVIFRSTMERSARHKAVVEALAGPPSS